MPVASCKFHPLSKAFPDHLIIAARERGTYRSDLLGQKAAERGRMEHGKSTGKVSMWSQPGSAQGFGLWSVNCTKVIPVFSQAGQGLCVCVLYI